MERNTLKDAVACLPACCYEKPSWKGLFYLSRDFIIYALVVAALLSTDRIVLLVPLWFVAALAISALFILGHDAAHGALFRSPRLCHVLGQAALLPSLHAFSVWALGHNRIHHRHTGRAGIDFVWHPLSPREYAALSLAAKLLHRIEWSPWGAGLYYARTVWWQRMSGVEPPRRWRRAFRRDRAIVWAFAAASGAILLALGWQRGSSFFAAAWTWGKVFVVPWLLWNYMIGVVVYVQHIAPDLGWHEESEWQSFRAQVEGTMNYRVPRWLNFFLHNILLHVPHHVDPRVPFYHLPRASEELSRTYGGLIRDRSLRWGDYVEITRRCKLYDFERAAWIGYGGATAGNAAAG